jgi:Ca-activated chloride channel family protein
MEKHIAAPAMLANIASPLAFMASPAFAPANTERYGHFEQNPVHVAAREPVSTFSLDVDTASYANLRRFLRSGELPPEDAVRVEELVNYFPYDYPAASGPHPFGVGTEVARAPWNPEHLLVRIGVKAQEPGAAQTALPPANLVFLVDVSGSMDEPNKLPLVQASLRMLVKQLRSVDRVSLVVYAGRTAVELPATPGNQQAKILAAIGRLNAEGSTNGGAALQLAYEQARAGFIAGGINRILMATDGDFNVGVTSNSALEERIRRERDSGVSLSMLAFGAGNLNDALMEQLADQGNGNYSYIDSVDEARKVLVTEMGATLHTVAKDVKVQVEFNPARVAEYRLLGYENRLLREENFRNDRVDAGHLAVAVLDGDLPLAVRPDPVPLRVGLPEPRQLAHERVAVLDRRRHELGGLVDGVAEHHSLIAGTLLLVESVALVHTLRDVRGLLLERDHDCAGIPVEALVRVVEPDVGDHLADDLGKVDLDLRRRGDFTSDHDQTGLHEGLAGHARTHVLP